MAMLIAELALSGSRKADGSVNALGRVFLTQIGSQAAVLGYQDRDKLASHALNSGGILLDSAGKAAIYVDSPCTVRVEDSTGAETASYTAAPVSAAELVEVTNSKFMGTDANGQSVAGARIYLDTVLTRIGVSLGGQDGAFRGLFGTTDRSVFVEIEDLGINAKRFGATGDGVTDDTAALTAAIAAAAAATTRPGRVFLPSGTYKITSVLSVIRGVSIVGAGENRTVINNANTLTGVLAISASVTPTTISDLTISSASPSASEAISIDSSSGYRAKVERVTITGHRTGVLVFGTGTATIRDSSLTCDSHGSAAGVRTGTGQAGVLLEGVTVDPGALGTGVELNGSSYCTAVGCTVALTGAAGYSMTGAANGLALVGGTTKNVSIAGTSKNFTNLGCDITAATQVADTVAEGTTWRFALANGGTATVNEHYDTTFKIRATSAGSGTIASTAKISRSKTLNFILFNNSGGAFTFNFSAAFSVSSAPAPGNGSAIGIMFVYNETENRYNELGRTAAYTP